jgi:hypothetical protein
MAELVLYPRKSVRAFYGPQGELVIVAECPRPWLGLRVAIAEAPEKILPPIYQIVAEFVWDPPGLAAGPAALAMLGGGGGGMGPGGGDPAPGDGPDPLPSPVPLPFPPVPMPPHLPPIDLRPTITVTGVFRVGSQPEKVTVRHAGGEDQVKVEPIFETAGGPGGGGDPLVALLPDAGGNGGREAGAEREPGTADGIGHSDRSFEEAFSRAANDALGKLGPSGVMDGMTVVTLVESGALYGGIAGLVGQRFVRVRARQDLATARRARESLAAVGDGGIGGGVDEETRAELELSLVADPATVYVNAMPGGAIGRPQPRYVALTLSVKNKGGRKFEHLHRDAGIVRWAVLNGRTIIWDAPDLVPDVLTDASIEAGATRTWSTVWPIADVRRLLENQGITAVARFEPTGQSATAKIGVKIAV